MHLALLIFMFAMLSNCNTIRNEGIGYSLLELQKEFDFVNLDYFPEKPDSKNYFYKLDSISYTKSLNMCGAMLVDYLDEADHNNLIEKANTRAIDTYKPNKKCLLIVNMLSNEVSGSIFLDYYKKYCPQNYIPIHDFNSLLGRSYPGYFSKEGKLNNNFTIYILKAEPGNFIPLNYISEGIGLPNTWRNGYSSGIAINKEENIAIYWIEVW